MPNQNLTRARDPLKASLHHYTEKNDESVFAPVMVGTIFSMQSFFA